MDPAELHRSLDAAARFRSGATVRARRLVTGTTWRTPRGDVLRGRPGDWEAAGGAVSTTASHPPATAAAASAVTVRPPGGENGTTATSRT